MATPGELAARFESILEQINQRLDNLGERVAKVEGILEQMNERLGRVEGLLEQKADKSEVRFLFVTTITLLVAIIGLLGAVLAKA
jgi:hypothetical protein